jgi:hypothetical protein
MFDMTLFTGISDVELIGTGLAFLIFPIFLLLALLSIPIC